MSNEFASLILNVDSSSARGAADDLDRLTDRGKKTERQTKGVTDEFTKLTAKLFPATRVLADLERMQGMLNAKLKSGEINATQYANAMERVRARTDQAQRSLDELGGKAQRGNTLMGMLGRTLAGLSIGAGIATGIRAVISETMEAEQVQAQLEARLRSTNAVSGMTIKSLNDIADSLMRVTTVDDEAIGGVQAILLTFTKIGQANFAGATEAVLNLSQAMGVDLNSAAKLVGKALNDPVKGVSALSRAGVQLTADQKELVKSMVEAGDIAGAQNIILRELETQMGGAAEAARNTLGGAIKGLKNNFMNLLEGDSGSDGVRGARASIEELSDLMASGEVRNAFANITEGIFSVAGAFVSIVTESNKAWNSVQKWVGFQVGDVFGGLKNTNDMDQLQYNLGKKLEQLKTLQDQAARLPAPLRGMTNRQIVNTSGEVKEIAEKIKLNKMIGLDNRQAPSVAKPKPAPRVTQPTPEDDEDKPKKDKKGRTGGGGRSSRASTADQEAKQRAREFQSLRDSLRSEEQVIEDSYSKRKTIIEQNTTAGSDLRTQLLEKVKAEYDEDLAALKAKNGRELQSVRDTLLSEEEKVRQSYEARRQIVLKSMQPGPEREALLAKLDEQQRLEADHLRMANEERRLSIMEQYMTEQQYREEATRLEIADLDEKLRQKLILEEDYAAAVEAIHKREKARAVQDVADKLSGTADLLGALSSLTQQFAQGQGKQAKRMFEITKALNIAQISMNTAAAVMKAYSDPTLQYPANIMAAVAAGIAGAAQLAAVSSQKFAGAYDQGGYIPAGKYGLVGERGPELVRGPVAVTGRELTARRGTGGNGVINISNSTVVQMDGSTSNNSNGDQSTEAKQLTDMIDNRVREVVQREMRQGGIIWKMQNG